MPVRCLKCGGGHPQWECDLPGPMIYPYREGGVKEGRYIGPVGKVAAGVIRQRQGDLGPAPRVEATVVELKADPVEKALFDKKAYQRELMRQRRAAAKEQS